MITSGIFAAPSAQIIKPEKQAAPVEPAEMTSSHEEESLQVSHPAEVPHILDVQV